MDIKNLLSKIEEWFYAESDSQVDESTDAPDTEVTEAPAEVVEEETINSEPEIEIPGAEESLIEIPTEEDSQTEEVSIEGLMTKISELEAANDALRSQIESYSSPADEYDPISSILFDEDSEEIDSDELDMIDDFAAKF